MFRRARSTDRTSTPVWGGGATSFSGTSDWSAILINTLIRLTPAGGAWRGLVTRISRAALDDCSRRVSATGNRFTRFTRFIDLTRTGFFRLEKGGLTPLGGQLHELQLLALMI